MSRASLEGRTDLEYAPGKSTVKAPDGRRKARIVVCGNMVEGSIDSQESEGTSSYGNKEKRWSNYASGIDGTTIRAVLRKAGHEDWCCSCTDVCAAFLLAPRQNQNGILIVKPPQILREAGLVGSQDLWKAAIFAFGLGSLS